MCTLGYTYSLLCHSCHVVYEVYTFVRTCLKPANLSRPAINQILSKLDIKFTKHLSKPDLE